VNALPTAVFLDRDGTIIEDRSYISDPREVALLPGIADAISRINATLVPAIVVTNQSGIGRGYFTAEQGDLVTERVVELLARAGARIDAWYTCPHAPDENCECRKPGLLLFRRAAAENPGVDLARALYVGDRRRDVEPALALGGQGVLVPAASTPADELEWARANVRVAPSLATAVDWFLCTN
jgi:histidinol-phosphate phosphatase family protein